jgi:HAD superfamily hydrolase (TIGR01509 family)
LILQKLKVLPEEAIFVDDFPENIEGANALGIHGIQFNSREQAISEVDQLLS